MARIRKAKQQQLELDLFTDNAGERVSGLPREHMSQALIATLAGESHSAHAALAKLSAADRYRFRVACRILILESSRIDRMDPSA